MAKVISSMVNLNVLILEWSEFILNKYTQRLLESTRSVFNTSLCKLVLDIRVTEFSRILGGVRLDGLEELELTFEYDHTATPDTITGIPQFIGNLSFSLRSLKISSSATLDHPQFFKALGHFQNLRLLSTQLPFDGTRLSDPSGLNQMLRCHRFTLHHLELLPQPREGPFAENPSTWPMFLEQCLLDLAQWPTGLQSLTIPSFDLPTLMSLIRQVANSLTSLRLVRRYLTCLEVSDVVDLFGRRSAELKHLSLEVTLMTPALLSMLARKLPGLVSLTVVVEHVNKPTCWNGRDKIDWNLYDLSIFNKRFRDDSRTIIAPVSFELEEILDGANISLVTLGS